MKEAEPIQGWLVLIGIWLWGEVIIVPLAMVPFFLLNVVPPVPLWVETVQVLVTWVLTLIALVFFMKRKSAFIPWFIGLQLWGIVDSLLYLIHFHTRNDGVGLIVSLILLLYTNRSSRVKKTFVRS